MTICKHCLHERLCREKGGVTHCMNFEPAWPPAQMAVEVFGAERQKLVAIGEMGELATAMSDHMRGRKTVLDIADEIADVEQVLEELKVIYGIRKDVLLAKPRKARKLALEIIAEMEKKAPSVSLAADSSLPEGAAKKEDVIVLEKAKRFPAEEFAWGKIDFEFEKKIRQRIKENTSSVTADAVPPSPQGEGL